MIAPFEDIDAFANQCFEKALIAATTIQFSERAEKYSKLSESAAEIRASHISDDPEYAQLDTAFGMGAWSVILSVDMRGSSHRAVRVGAKQTYLTMHTYLPTMAELVKRAEGKIVGLRGDGLFAAFGLTKLVGSKKEVTPEVASKAAKGATHCGKAMLEAVDEIINPLLDDNDVEGGLKIGVGIEVGDVVITRIGLQDANELTAYGPPVNKACKLCNQTDGILLSKAVESLFPTSKGGKMRFRANNLGFVPVFPDGMVMLEHGDNLIGQRRPR